MERRHRGRQWTRGVRKAFGISRAIFNRTLFRALALSAARDDGVPTDEKPNLRIFAIAD
ncbi:MAG: hypothetical protein ACR2IA_09375 [Pyrinomonadaceae bacterium]